MLYDSMIEIQDDGKCSYTEISMLNEACASKLQAI